MFLYTLSYNIRAKMDNQKIALMVKASSVVYNYPEKVFLPKLEKEIFIII